MASGNVVNVEFYEKMKELQDVQQASETKRFKLEQKLHAYYKSDRRLAALKNAKLQSYWKKISEEEKKSRARNESLLKECERVDSNLSMLSERTKQLRLMKQQYENYIDQKYPQWKAKVMEWQAKQQEPVDNVPQAQQPRQLPVKRHPVQQGPLAYELVQQPEVSATEVKKDDSPVILKQQQQYYLFKMEYAAPVFESYIKSSTEASQQKPAMIVNAVDVPDTTPVVVPPLFKREEATLEEPVSHVSTSDWPTSPVNSLSEVSELPSATPRHPIFSPGSSIPDPVIIPRQTTPHEKISDLPSATPRHPQFMPRRSTPSPERSAARRTITHHSASNDSHILSPKISFHDASPLQLASSSEIEKSNKSTIKADSEADDTLKNQQPAVTPRSHHSQESISQRSLERQQNIENRDSDEISENLSLPLSSGKNEKKATSPVLSDESVSHKSSLVVNSDQLTYEGLYNLLKSVQNDFETTFTSHSFYRDIPPTYSKKREIIFSANSGDNLDHNDPVLLSMVVKEELASVIKSLPSSCLLSDELLRTTSHITKDVTIRSYLSPTAANMWDKLYVHMQQMVHHNIMGPSETAQLFSPQLVSRFSTEKSKAVSLLTTLLQNTSQDESVISDTEPESVPGSPTRQSPLKTGSPTKLNSILENGDFFSQPIANDTTPLTQTAAYRSLLSGTATFTSHGDDSDIDDIETQLAVGSADTNNRLTVPTGTLDNTRGDTILGSSHGSDQLSSRRDESIGSSLSAASPAYIPTAIDRSGGGSNLGSSTGARRLAALRTGSDTETEVDLDISKSKQPHQEDERDDFDFYDS
ncbi:uncharacterized protein LOC141908303 isoform X2 [Tubulanus polymorphus]|uniref:uncharacterized protein LOC141908303 isoform X2 n=1 Tax=Tubulanus polymorphus TaxID=672921 RepID=UPI003DA36FC3